MQCIKNVGIILFMATVLIAEDITPVADSTVTAPSSSIATQISNTQEDSTQESSSAVTPLCTLEITTTPSEAFVLLNGIHKGSSPCVISDLKPGKYTVILKKVGFFQKKVVITLNTAGKTVLPLTLQAPGRFTITTVPPGVTVAINGKNRGVTPYVDSLLKPATYSMTLSKEHYTTVTDSVTVTSLGNTLIIDTLTFTDAYRDSLQQAQEHAKKQRKRFTIGIVAGVFSLFLLVLAIVELQERS